MPLTTEGFVDVLTKARVRHIKPIPKNTAETKRAELKMERAVRRVFHQVKPKVVAEIKIRLTNLLKLQKGNEDQPRDDRGRWTSTGGGENKNTSATSMAPENKYVGRTLYHFTSPENASRIESGGKVQPNDGLYGKAAYFTEAESSTASGRSDATARVSATVNPDVSVLEVKGSGSAVDTWLETNGTPQEIKSYDITGVAQRLGIDALRVTRSSDVWWLVFNPAAVSVSNGLPNTERGEPSHSGGTKIRKASPAKVSLDATATVTLTGLNAIASEPIITNYGDVAVDAGMAAFVSIGAKAQPDIINQINERAMAWARDRAAELVGMKWDENGDLVDNPNAEWAIDQSTRDMLRETIRSGMDEGMGVDELTAAIEDGYAFSDLRARMIARTEISYAHNQGALIGYLGAKDIGVNVKKEWLLGEDPCDICLDNADEGPIDLEELFPSGDDVPPAHPNCECAVAPVVEGDEGFDQPDEGDAEDQVEAVQKEFHDDQPRDERGRWTAGGGGYGGEHPDVRGVEGSFIWGASHSGSKVITGRSAAIMGISGYKDSDTSGDKESEDTLNRVSTSFLQAIADSPGASEPLYHGFENAAGIDWKEGDTLKLPLLATSGNMDSSASYGIRTNNPEAQKGPSTVFEFPVGTKMAGYAQGKKSDYQESIRDYGYASRWDEAIIAGSYRVVGTRTETHFDWRQSQYTVVRLEPTGYYDPATKGWKNV